MRDRLNEIHDYVTVDADRRDKDTESRHKELMRALDQINQTMRDLAEAINRSARAYSR